MFEVGFSELMMVGLVSLLVVGPERLPKLARFAGFWMGKARNMVAMAKAEISQEIREEELRQFISRHASLDQLEKVVADTTESVNLIKQDIEQSTEFKAESIVPHEPG